ncbi:nuclear-interacting partner of ALK isoform 2, partial [Aphelenchoides avenae]
MKRKAEDPPAEGGSGTFLKKLRTSIRGYIGSAQGATTDKTPQPSVEDKTLEEYAGRLATYRDHAWCRSLPKEVSAATCAKRGWTVIAENMLQCARCKKMICASLPAASKVSTRVHSFCV